MAGEGNKVTFNPYDVAGLVRQALKDEARWRPAGGTVAIDTVNRLLVERGQHNVANLVAKTQELALNDRVGEAPAPAYPITQEELGELAGLIKQHGVTSKDLAKAIRTLDQESGTIEQRRAYADGAAALRLFLGLRNAMHRYQRETTPEGAARPYDWSCSIAEPKRAGEIHESDSPFHPDNFAKLTSRQQSAFGAPWERAVVANCRTSLPAGTSLESLGQIEHPGVKIPLPKGQAGVGSRQQAVPLAPRRASDTLSAEQERSIAAAFVAALGKVGLVDDVSDLGSEHLMQEETAARETFARVMQGDTLDFAPGKSSRKEPFLAVVKALYDARQPEPLLAHRVYGNYDGIWDARAKAAFKNGIDRATLAALVLGEQ
ncbi:MAG: hypothetical protein AAB426_14460 [Myxococcota bacterium]